MKQYTRQSNLCTPKTLFCRGKMILTSNSRMTFMQIRKIPINIELNFDIDEILVIKISNVCFKFNSVNRKVRK